MRNCTSYLGKIYKIMVNIHLKENQLHSQFISNIFRQTLLHVSGVSIVNHQEVHPMDTTLGTYCSFQLTVCCPGSSQDNSHLKEQ